MKYNVSQGIFITGTDTGVGKTYVTAALLAELRRGGAKAAAFKPIACGEGGRDDARLYHELMEGEVPLDTINPIFLRHPLAPENWSAAESTWQKSVAPGRCLPLATQPFSSRAPVDCSCRSNEIISWPTLPGIWDYPC